MAVTLEIVSGPATIDGNTITLDGVSGTVIVKASQGGNDTYAYVEAFRTFAVSEVVLLDQTISWTPIADRFTIDTPIEAMAVASSNLPVSYTILSGPATINGNTIYLDGVAGTVVVEAVQTGNAEYYPTSESIAFEVMRQDQSINWIGIADKLTIDAPFTILAEASSNLGDIYYSIISGPATIDDDQITLDGIAGTVVVQATQPGNDDYNPVSENYSFEVLRQDQSITWTVIDDKYTFDDPFEIMAQATSGLEVSLRVASGPATLDGNLITLDGIAGTVILEAEQAGDDDFNPAPVQSISFHVIEVVPDAQEIDFEIVDDQFTDADPITLVASASSGLEVELSVVSGPAVLNGNVLTLDGVIGLVTLAANQAGDNFFLPAPEVTQTFEVKLFSSTHETALANSLNIYPNPAREIIFISSQNARIAAVNVYNILGEKIKVQADYTESSKIQIPVAGLISGCYTLEIEFDNGAQIGRIFIKE